MEKQKASTYEYNGKGESTVSNERKEELKEKVNKIISKNESVALHKILDISRTEAECQILFNYLEESGILLRGINASLAGELPNYEHLPKDGQSYLPQVLNHEETIRLFEIKANGTEEEKAEARSKLAEHNLRLVYWIVGTRIGGTRLGIEQDDLISFGSEALMKAIDGFDYTRGIKFSTYAVGKIYWEIRNQILRQPRLVHVPTHITEKIMEVESTRELISEEKEKQGMTTEVTADEIASVTNLPLETVENVLKAIQSMNIESIDDMLDEDKDTIEEGILIDRGEPEEFTSGEDEVDRITFTADIKEKMAEILDTLTPREEEVIRHRFGMVDGRQWSLDEIGKKYNVTQERIRQIEAKAIRKLRHPSRARKLETYAEEKVTPINTINNPQEDASESSRNDTQSDVIEHENPTIPIVEEREGNVKTVDETQNKTVSTKELVDEILTIFGDIRDSYQSIETRIQQNRQLETQLRNMQAELLKEKQKLIEYISKLKELINSNKETLEKMIQLETLLEALQKAEERLAQIEAEELAYQNQINRIIQERENNGKKKSSEVDI